MARSQRPVRVRVDRVADVVRIDEVVGVELDVEAILAEQLTQIELRKVGDTLGLSRRDIDVISRNSAAFGLNVEAGTFANFKAEKELTDTQRPAITNVVDPETGRPTVVRTREAIGQEPAAQPDGATRDALERRRRLREPIDRR